MSYLRHTDWLGSSRFATTWGHAVYSKTSYAPFGETYNEPGTADRSFTGQDQDVITGSGATGVYDFLYRKHDPSAGRWLSPDPSGWAAVDFTNPQSLNRYAYVLNNPLSYVDAFGLKPIPCEHGDTNGVVNVCDDGDGPIATCDPWYWDIGCMAVFGETGTEIPYEQITPFYVQSQDIAPSNPGTPTACQQTVLNAVNNQFSGANLNAGNILPSSSPDPQQGGQVNVNFGNFGPGQFTGIQPGRYAPGGFIGFVTGYGPSLHVVSAPSGLDPNALNFSQTSFTAHIDSAWANNPIGALLHLIIDVLGAKTRNPCP